MPRKELDRVDLANQLLKHGFTYKETGDLVNRHSSSVFGWFSPSDREAFIRPFDPDKRRKAMKQHRRKWEIEAKNERPIFYWATNIKSRAKTRAEKLRIPFDLTTEYLENLYKQTNGICPVFQAPFTLFEKSSPLCPSLDRIIPVKGYAKNNVAIISIKANLIKSDATAEEIAKVANWLRRQYEHSN